MQLNYTDGIKTLHSWFLLGRNKSVTACLLMLLRQIRLSAVSDRWWGSISRPLWSCVTRIRAAKRRLRKLQLWERLPVPLGEWSGLVSCWEDTWAQGQGRVCAAAMAGSPAAPRAGREAVQTLTACGIPEGPVACCSQTALALPLLWISLRTSQPQYARSVVTCGRSGLPALMRAVTALH